MRVGKVVVRVILVVVLVLLVVAGVLYWQASRIPDAYDPADGLTAEQRLQVAKNFGQHLSDFNNIAQRTTPGEWQITQKQLNQYLASMDEIAWYSGSSKRGDVQRQMDKAGISGPAAALGDGVLTLMFRSRKYNKIVSADVTFSYTDDRKLQVRLAQTRVGTLPIPAGLVRDRLGGLKKALSRRPSKTPDRRADPAPDRETKGASAEDVGRLLAGLIGAIDEAPIKPEFVMRLNRKRVRIDAIRIEPGVATLEITPLRKDKRKKG